MMLFSLGKRLALCASMVRGGAALADVGTDHAYLPVWLAKQGRIAKAIASDVRPGPLEHARKNIERYGAGDLVTVRLADGLDGILPGEADDIVIAGMGGLMMADIVGRAAWLKDPGKRLILQPMTRAEDLRRSLSEQGFAVLREQAVREEGHLYTAMLCRYDPQHRAEGELFPYIGGLTADTPESRAYLRREMKRLRDRADGLRLEGRGEEAERLFRLRRQIVAMLPSEETGSEESVLTAGEIYRYIDGFAPFATAMSFDNCGFQAGDEKTEVHTVLLSLDITPEVVREAARRSAELIISHHPVIFNPLRSLRVGTAPYLLAQYGIAAICAHTNLDLAPGGVNTCLAASLGLKDPRTLVMDKASGLPAALIGRTEHEYEPRGFAEFVKHALGCDGLFYTDGGRKISTVGLCSGAGSEYVYDAAAHGCQAFVTGEAKHHELNDAENLGVTLIAAGHFYTENIVLGPLRERLAEKFPDVEFLQSEKSHCPAKYL